MNTSNMTFFGGILLVALQVLSGCELSVRDQVLLIELSQQAPPPGGLEISSVEGTIIQCAELTPLVLIRPSATANFVYVLDPRRVFNRWSSTGGAPDDNFLRVLGGYLDRYRKVGKWSSWSQYGVLPLPVPSSVIATTLNWQEYRVLSKQQFDSAKAQLLPESDQDFFRELIRERIRAYLVVNDPYAKIIDFRYPQLSNMTGNAIIVVRITRLGKAEEVEFLLPVNAARSPFIGYPVRR